MKTYDLPKKLEALANDFIAAEDILSTISNDDVACLIFSRFEDDHGEAFAMGESILEGDVTGPLVLSRDVAKAINNNNDVHGSTRYIYSVAEGDIDDFQAIKHSSAFFTNNKGKTTFSPVQSVSEGKPTIISVPVEYYESEEDVELVFQRSDGISWTVQTKKRWISLETTDGNQLIIAEGNPLSLACGEGKVFSGKRPLRGSDIEDVYTLLARAYDEAEQEFGPELAWNSISETKFFHSIAPKLTKLTNSDLFAGFQKLRDFAAKRTPLNVLVNVHNTSCVVKAKLLASTVWMTETQCNIADNGLSYGVGLLRDERMWTDPEDIDMLRIILLGPDCATSERYAQAVSDYKERHGSKYYSIFCAQPGDTCVIRTLCMPFSKFLPDTFDIKAFCERQDLDVDLVAKAFSRISGEKEVYHGCRGIRLFSIRPDLLELWLQTVLSALKKARDAGIRTDVRFLLATLTLPEEAKIFIDALEPVAADIFGSAEVAPIDGVSSMLETCGAFISLEEIFSQRGNVFRVNGGLIGTNDFTTACLNMNRGDAPKYLIPGYVEKGIFPASPFKHVYAPIVGKAMQGALQRSTQLGLGTGQKHLWGLAGELTTDWESMKWLSKHLAPVGLDYVSTSPETIVQALFAATSTLFENKGYRQREKPQAA